jgi:hypothetical protein
MRSREELLACIDAWTCRLLVLVNHTGDATLSDVYMEMSAVWVEEQREGQ